MKTYSGSALLRSALTTLPRMKPGGGEAKGTGNSSSGDKTRWWLRNKQYSKYRKKTEGGSGEGAFTSTAKSRRFFSLRRRPAATQEGLSTVGDCGKRETEEGSAGNSHKVKRIFFSWTTKQTDLSPKALKQKQPRGRKLASLSRQRRKEKQLEGQQQDQNTQQLQREKQRLLRRILGSSKAKNTRQQGQQEQQKQVEAQPKRRLFSRKRHTDKGTITGELHQASEVQRQPEELQAYKHNAKLGFFSWTSRRNRTLKTMQQQKRWQWQKQLLPWRRTIGSQQQSEAPESERPLQQQVEAARTGTQRSKPLHTLHIIQRSRNTNPLGQQETLPCIQTHEVLQQCELQREEQKHDLQEYKQQEHNQQEQQEKQVPARAHQCTPHSDATNDSVSAMAPAQQTQQQQETGALKVDARHNTLTSGKKSSPRAIDSHRRRHHKKSHRPVPKETQPPYGDKALQQQLQESLEEDKKREALHAPQHGDDEGRYEHGKKEQHPESRRSSKRKKKEEKALKSLKRLNAQRAKKQRWPRHLADHELDQAMQAQEESEELQENQCEASQSAEHDNELQVLHMSQLLLPVTLEREQQLLPCGMSSHAHPSCSTPCEPPHASGAAGERDEAEARQAKAVEDPRRAPLSEHGATPHEKGDQRAQQQALHRVERVGSASAVSTPQEDDIGEATPTEHHRGLLHHLRRPHKRYSSPFASLPAQQRAAELPTSEEQQQLPPRMSYSLPNPTQSERRARGRKAPRGEFELPIRTVRSHGNALYKDQEKEKKQHLQQHPRQLEAQLEEQSISLTPQARCDISRVLQSFVAIGASFMVALRALLQAATTSRNNYPSGTHT
ncbi:hypothetical protein cyc_03501 [Cyclospora cayetanensis]|uniref:Uncharacterized protein n=1 Tax=Cyclospora cayetanensis TaxID=88456 RepID=A0A1D3CRS8_9EIME|nr:hypothetical protein cyc_03501 [Cyclospora cayetanensis]